MIVDPRLKHVEARARLIRLLIANTTARELIKILARIHPLLHERHHPLRGFLAGFRVAHALGTIPLPDARFVLQFKILSLIPSLFPFFLVFPFSYFFYVLFHTRFCSSLSRFPELQLRTRYSELGAENLEFRTRDSGLRTQKSLLRI